jgi:transcription initiation factor TFIIIB Brf1 subunit/transcription initiation factor TFIIB
VCKFPDSGAFRGENSGTANRSISDGKMLFCCMACGQVTEEQYSRILEEAQARSDELKHSKVHRYIQTCTTCRSLRQMSRVIDKNGVVICRDTDILQDMKTLMERQSKGIIT